MPLTSIVTAVVTFKQASFSFPLESPPPPKKKKKKKNEEVKKERLIVGDRSSVLIDRIKLSE